MGIFNTRLKQLREKNRETQTQLAEAIDSSPQNISAYEKERQPSYEMLCDIARHYKVSVDYLLGYSKPNDRIVSIDFTDVVRIDETYKQLLPSKYAYKYLGLADEVYRFIDDYADNKAFLSIYPYNGIHEIIDFATSVDKSTDVEEFAKKCFKLSSKLQSMCQYMYDKFLESKEFVENAEEE